MISNGDNHLATASQYDAAESLISALQEERNISRAKKSERKQIEIMDVAIALFSKNGYERTTLDAIAEKLHMAKGTIYLYFESKEELFLECIKRLTVVAVPEDAWNDIRKEKNALKRLKKRGIAFHRAFPSYKGILTMTKGALGDDNQKLAEKAKDTLIHMTQPMARDIHRGIADGIFREVDEDILSHLLLAMGEGLGCRLMIDSRCTIEKGIEIMFDLVAHGILKSGFSKAPKAEHKLSSSEVTDLKGVVTKVRNIRFGNMSYLPAKIGEAEVRINPEKVEKIKFLQHESLFLAEILGSDGQAERAVVDGKITLSGEVSIGQFSIELRNITSILKTPRDL